MLLFQENRYGITELGLQGGLTPYINCLGEYFLFEEVELPTEGCVQLSFVYQAERLELYVNGQLRQNLSVVLPSPIMEENIPFYLGQRFPDGATTFSGRMEDMRIFRHALSLAEIQQRLFREVEMTAHGKYLHLDFYQHHQEFTRDPYNSAVFALLGGLAATAQHMPLWTEDFCMKNGGTSTEGVNSNCQTDPTLMPPCAAPPANEFLCNGDFEQFCSVLRNPPTNALPNNAFDPYLVWGTGSDVVNWESVDPIISNAHFFVRGGLGSPIGFNPECIFPPSSGPFSPWETHNGNGDGVAALRWSYFVGGTYGPGSPSIIEGLQTHIYQPQNLQPGNVYVLSGWTFATQDCWPLTTNTFPNAQVIVNIIDNNGVAQALPLSISAPNYSSIPQNNGWSFFSYQFILPPLSGSATHFEKLRFSIDHSTSDPESYVFFDDLSLQPYVPTTFPSTNFPAYINTGEGNDLFRRIIKEDAQGNIYVAGQVYVPYTNPSTTTYQLQYGLQTPIVHPFNNQQYGSFIAKYSSNGNLEWEHYQEHTLITDFEIVGNEILTVGYINPVPAGIINSAPFNFNGLINTGLHCSTPYDPNSSQTQLSNPQLSMINESENMFLMRLDNSSNNATNLIGSIQVWGGSTDERAIGLEIFGNTAKIALNVCEVVLPTIPPNTTAPPIQHLMWGQFLPCPTNSILEYSLLTNQPAMRTLLNQSFSSDYLIDFDSDGSNWYLLTNANLIKEGGNSQLLPSNSAQSYSAHEMYVMSNGDIFLAYNENTNSGSNPSIPPFIEKRNSSLNFVASFSAPSNAAPPNSYAIPLSITGDGAGIYVAYEYLQSVPQEDRLMIIKYDPNLMNGNPLWTSPNAILSDGLNSRFANSLGEFSYQPMDMVPRAIGGLALIGNFSTSSANWDWDLSPKTISYTGTTLLPSSSHTFVAVINDEGTHAVFGKRSVTDGSRSNNLVVYPNPVSSDRILRIQSSFLMSEIKIYDVRGNLLSNLKLPSATTETDLPMFQFQKGVYILEVFGVNRKEIERLIVE